MTNRIKQINRFWLGGLVILGLTLLLSACSSASSPTAALPPPTNTAVAPTVAPTASAKEVPFTPLEEDLAYIAGSYERFTAESTKQNRAIKFLPTVAQSTADVNWFPQMPNSLATLDWRQEIAILIYMQGGSKSLYGIQIKQIVQNGDKIKVVCNVRQPPPDAITTQILNYLYSAVAVRRASFLTQGELTFSFVDQSGTLLAETKVRL
jgi:hypothetical protein